MPNRTCIVTRQVFPIDDMIRFVCDNNGQIYPDIKATLPGRGAWVYAQKQVLEKAIKTKAFARSFKKTIVTDMMLINLTETLLKKDALNMLSLARKVGAVITGGLKIEKAANKPSLFLVLHNEDAAIDGKRKILNALKIRQTLELEPVPIFTLFTHDDLAQVFGEKCVTHIALLKHSVSKNFLHKAKKLQFYRGSTINNISSVVKESKRND